MKPVACAAPGSSLPRMTRRTCESFVLSSVLPFSETDTGTFLPVLGMEMSTFFVPVHKHVLHSALLKGDGATEFCAMSLSNNLLSHRVNW